MAVYQKEGVDSWNLVHAPADYVQPWLALVGSWRRDLMPENSDFSRMDKESWERVTSVTPRVN